MARPRGKKHPARMSVSLDAATYADLRALSREYDVSAAWVLRRAAASRPLLDAHTLPEVVLG
jgi:hypothetical protein